VTANTQKGIPTSKAMLSLARRASNVLWAMLRYGNIYTPIAAQPVTVAAKRAGNGGLPYEDGLRSCS
jgi:hypothetical protein